MRLFTESGLNWICDVLKERFGVNFFLNEKNYTLVLSIEGSEKKILFDKLQEIFHNSKSDFPCYKWQASKEGYKFAIDDFIPLPSEYELPKKLMELNENGAVVHYDILGLTYWMLSRLEEVGRSDLDTHDRFPAKASHAYRHGYLERPIVDEWLFILGEVVERVFPDVKLKQSHFSIKVSHDVDRPSVTGLKTWPGAFKKMLGDIVKRKDLKASFRNFNIRYKTKDRFLNFDPYNTFDFLMDISEENNLKSAFYFICGRTNPLYDADYELEHPAIVNLLKRIHQRGHEIGLHPSYGTCLRSELIKFEADRLKRRCRELEIYQDNWGGRMHYLRWEQPTTLNAWEVAGMDYDSTLGYADSPGFRCGTCHEYPAFDIVRQKKLNLKVRPLIVMEETVLNEAYLGLDCSNEAKNLFIKLKESCSKVKGNFTLLWHNSTLYLKEQKKLYQKIIEQ